MLAAASNIETKIPATTKESKRMMMPGMIGELTGFEAKAYFMIIKLARVENKEMESLAINMKTSEKPSTKANFAAFFNIRIKALSAEEQKLSLEMAM